MPMGIGLGIGVTRGGGVGWWPAGSELAFEFDNGRGFNSIDRTKTTPDSILTYTNPSPKLVYGSDGVLRYAPHNRWLQSQTFDNASWIKNSGSISAEKATAPDGTITANKFIEAAATAVHYLQQNFDAAGQTINVSFYAKVAEREIVYIRFTNSAAASAYVWFNVSTGAVLTTNAGITAPPPTNAGNGFYRCSASIATVNGVGTFGIGISNADGVASYAGDGTSGIYVWGAQYSLGSSALTYIPTTTAAVYSLPIDHNPTTFAPLGVLIEEQRTNLLLRSQEFDNGPNWGKAACAITANTLVAPDGTISADTVTPTANTANVLFSNPGVSASAQNYTASCYVKAGTANWVNLSLWGGTGQTGVNCWFNIATGVIGGSAVTAGFTYVSHTMQDIGGGWYRLSVTGVWTASNMYLAFRFVDGDSAFNFTAVNGLTAYIWGAQAEQGAFPTSYIPTTNNPLGVTRLADQVSILTSAFGYSATAGTSVFAGDAIATNPGANRLLQTADAARLMYLGGTQVVIFDGTNIALEGTGIVFGTAFKAATAYGVAGLGVSLNGGTVGTGSFDGAMGSAGSLYLGSDNGVGAFLNGHIKRLTYFPTRRTNADLQVLTRGDDLVWGIGDYLVWGSGNNLTW